MRTITLIIAMLFSGSVFAGALDDVKSAGKFVFGLEVGYKPFEYISDPISALRIFDGGMSFHGGFLGVTVAVTLFCRKYEISILKVADVIAVSAPSGLLFGRLANFINAELWGRETTVPWAVIFPGYSAQNCIESVVGACARHPSQLYEALGEGLILGGVLLFLVFKTSAFRRTGLLTGVFSFGYGMVRFLVELVRQPDFHYQSLENPVGYALQLSNWGLTMGQILSLPMIGIGIWLIQRSSKV